MNSLIKSSIIQAKEIYYIKELFTNKKNISFSLVYKLTRDSEKIFIIYVIILDQICLF